MRVNVAFLRGQSATADIASKIAGCGKESGMWKRLTEMGSRLNDELEEFTGHQDMVNLSSAKRCQ